VLAAWGRFVHHHRWAVLLVSAAALLPSIWLVVRGGSFDNNPVPRFTESGRAIELVGKELPKRPPSFGLILGSSVHQAKEPAFETAVRQALEPLRADARVARVVTPYDDPMPDSGRISRDGHRVLATVELKGGPSEFSALSLGQSESGVYPELRAKVRSRVLEILPVGTMALNHDFTETATRAIKRAERVIWPVVPLLLVLVFGSVVGAALPLGVGVLGVTAGMAATIALSYAAPVSVYAVNVVSMVGFSVAVDYSLFVISRYRDELREKPGGAEALARTLATAGRAVLFSGLTVAIGLLGMLCLQLRSLVSMGLAGTAVVLLAVAFSLTFLPALLAILGRRVDALRIPYLHPEQSAFSHRAWRWLAAAVMSHPWRVLVPVVVGLVLVGSPFLRLRLAGSDASILPLTAESRRGEELHRGEFASGESSSIVVVLHDSRGLLRSAESVGRAYDFAQWLAGLPHVSRVQGPVALHPQITRSQYLQIFAANPEMLPEFIRQAVAQTASERLMVLAVSTPLRAGSTEAHDLVRAIRAARPPLEAEILVTGQSAVDMDIAQTIGRNAPLTVAVIVVATYVVLFLLLGSLLLPLQAVVMNVLSISASYGALVWIFQDGHLQRWLNFTPGPIETSTPIIMFCVMFGLSMDYEVFLLSRVREEYDRTGDNARAVALALERTGRLITGAAAIMAAVFFAFGTADMVPIQAIGIGMGIAVVVDATIVRALLVPAIMRVMGEWNWWAPAPLARLHRRLGLGEAH
jgi:putative drug exporter of the RND superfamily